MNVTRRRKRKSRRRAERERPRQHNDFVLDLDAFTRAAALVKLYQAAGELTSVVAATTAELERSRRDER